MTQFLTISLSKDDIFSQIRLYTSYLAGKRADSAIYYDRIAAIDQDRPIFIILIEEAAGDLALQLGGRVQSLENDGDIIRFTVNNPLWRIDLSLYDTPPNPVDCQFLLRAMRSYVTSATIIRWLNVLGTDFYDGCSTVSRNATNVTTDKFTLIDTLLTPPAPPAYRHILRANPRRIPPLP